MKDHQQILIVKQLLVGLLIFLAIGFASAILNDAGMINVILSFLLLVEPFLIVAAIICIPNSLERTRQLRKWVIGFVAFHILLVYAQYGAGFCNMHGDCDNIQGVFYRSGSGHVVGASVSASFAAYFFVSAKERPLWLRGLVFLVGFGNILLSDAKQVLLTFLVSFVVLSLLRKDIKKVALYVVGFCIFLSIFVWAIYQIEALSAFTTWIRPEIYGADGEATKLKLSGIQIILESFSSPFHWLLGLGPGHTIGRLGGWMLRDYAGLLGPLGATRMPIGEDVWQYVASSWLAEGSSMFSPFWGWAGIWGDLGFFGLVAYIYLGSIVWQKMCSDDLSKLLVLTIVVHGFIFTQLEEPGYMLSMATLLGLHWREQRTRILLKSMRIEPSFHSTR